MTNNTLRQMKGESLESYIARVRAMSNEERVEAAEQQRTAVLDAYHKSAKQSDYKRKVYHK